MDSAFTSIHRSVVLLDLVDEAWAADCLSDDGALRAYSLALIPATARVLPVGVAATRRCRHHVHASYGTT
jgi:hypothetical protein